MKKLAFIIIVLHFFLLSTAQFNKGRIEAYTSPGLFTTQLSNDTLVPISRRGGYRVGDVTTFGVQYGVALRKHLSVKAGIGYTVRRFSINKYSFNDLFTAIFLFDSPPHTDSFAIANVHYTNNYIEVPLSVNFGAHESAHTVYLNYGLNARLQFLIKSKAAITLDASTPAVQPLDMQQLAHAYTKDMNAFVLTIEPYLDINFHIYKGLGVYYRVKPFAFYASPLSSRVTKSESEFLGSGIAVWYQF